MGNMKKVILDTNVLMLPYEFKIDVIGEVARLVVGSYVFVTTDRALEELENLKKTKRVSSRAARFASIYVEHLKKKGLLEVVHGTQKVDDWIVGYAKENSPGVIVCTNDILLRQRLKGSGAKLIGLRSKSHLDFV